MLSAIPWLGHLFGVGWVVCAAGLLSRRTMKSAAMMLSGLLFVVGAVVFDVSEECGEPRQYFFAYDCVRTACAGESCRGLARMGLGSVFS
jgi:hypothetical protein